MAKKRERNIAHFWADKRVYRLFRKYSDRSLYHKLFSVYTALCIIDSDFSQYREDPQKGIKNITKTCSTYAGINKDNTSKCLQLLKKIGLIDYGPKKNEKTGKYTTSSLIIFDFSELKTSFLQNGNPVERKPDGQEHYKNNILNILYTTLKNSSKEENNSNTIASKEAIPDSNKSGLVFPKTPTPRKLKQKIKVESKPRVSKEIENIIIFWNGLGMVKHNIGTKTYYNIASCLDKLINGKYFDKDGPFGKYAGRKFGYQEIVDTMQKFSLAATNWNYLPVTDYKKTLKKTGILHFLHNPYGNKEKSLFLEYFENEPQLVKEEAKLTIDDDPETTRIIKQLWVNKILGGVEPIKWGAQDENNFRRCTKCLTIFFKSNIKKIDSNFGVAGTDIISKRNRVELLFEAILDDVNGNTSKLSPGWLCSTMTWNTRVPKYLFAQGVISEE